MAIAPARHPITMSRSGFIMDYARQMLRSTGDADMIILDSDASVFAMLYLDVVEHAAGDRVLLVPSLFGYPPYQRWLARRNPGLNIPPEFTMDWTQWARLNASRGLCAEAESWNELRGSDVQGFFLKGPFPGSAPSGVLIRASAQAPEPQALRSGIERLLEWHAVSHADLYPFSPEMELVNTYRLMLNWGLQSLPSGVDPDLTEKLQKRLNES